MKCRSCSAPLYSDRSPYCLPCSAADCLAKEFQQPFGSSVVRNLATDVALSAARQVRAFRLFSLRAREKEEGRVTLREKEAEVKRPGGGDPRSSKVGAPANSERERGDEPSEYSYTEEEHSRDKPEEDESSTLTYPTAEERRARTAPSGGQPPCVASKSAPPIKPPPKRSSGTGEDARRKESRRSERSRTPRREQGERRGRGHRGEVHSGEKQRGRGFELVVERKEQPDRAGSRDRSHEPYLADRFFRLPAEEEAKPSDSGKGSWQKKRKRKK